MWRQATYAIQLSASHTIQTQRRPSAAPCCGEAANQPPLVICPRALQSASAPPRKQDTPACSPRKKVLPCPTLSQTLGRAKRLPVQSPAHHSSTLRPPGRCQLATNAHSLGRPHQHSKPCPSRLHPPAPALELRQAGLHICSAQLVCHQPAPGAGPGRVLRRRNYRSVRSPEPGTPRMRRQRGTQRRAAQALTGFRHTPGTGARAARAAAQRARRPASARRGTCP